MKASARPRDGRIEPRRRCPAGREPFPGVCSDPRCPAARGPRRLDGVCVVTTGKWGTSRRADRHVGPGAEFTSFSRRTTWCWPIEPVEGLGNPEHERPSACRAKAPPSGGSGPGGPVDEETRSRGARCRSCMNPPGLPGGLSLPGDRRRAAARQLHPPAPPEGCCRSGCLRAKVLDVQSSAGPCAARATRLDLPHQNNPIVGILLKRRETLTCRAPPPLQSPGETALVEKVRMCVQALKRAPQEPTASSFPRTAEAIPEPDLMLPDRPVWRGRISPVWSRPSTPVGRGFPRAGGQHPGGRRRRSRTATATKVIPAAVARRTATPECLRPNHRRQREA